MFLDNDLQKVFEIGTNKTIFIKNKAEVAWELSSYEVIPVMESQLDIEKENVLLKLYNPYDLPVRADKIIMEIFHITRSKAKKLLSGGQISLLFTR